MGQAHIDMLRKTLAAERGALAARIIADLDFKAVHLTGAGLTNMHLDLPDLGFMDPAW